jgi:hypothetical protein
MTSPSATQESLSNRHWLAQEPCNLLPAFQRGRFFVAFWRFGHVVSSWMPRMLVRLQTQVDIDWRSWELFV